ncbi:MAG: haloacid dehalogenase type II [Gammaproteobacteria bacterium]
MQLTDFEALSFDCYGTLIDWETGIHDALQPWLDRHAIAVSRAELLEAFGRCEARQQAETPAMLYAQLLGEVLKALGRHWNAPVTAAQAQAFGDSIQDWPAFPDSAGALQYLKRHYQLYVLSNVDKASFKHSNAKLGVEFDAIYTAQDVGSYKPALRNFEYLIARLGERGIEKSKLLHTAQSLFHDHVPATRMGLATCWIDRRRGQIGAGATVPPSEPYRIDFHFGSLGEFADQHRAIRRGEPGGSAVR